MKFGHTFLAHQVPEWQYQYLDYKKLKQIIKKITLRQAELNYIEIEDDEVMRTDLGQFIFVLGDNISKIDDFYSKKFIQYETRLKKITTVLPSNLDKINEEEIDDVISILLESRNCLRNLKWYGELNKRGVVKILKKLDKKLGTNKQEAYLKSHVFPLSFADDAEIVHLLSTINNLLSELSNIATDSYYLVNNSKLVPPTSTFLQRKESTVGRSSATQHYLYSIEDDNVDELEKLLTENFMSPVMAPLKLLLSLLNKAALNLSYKCIDKLLQIIPGLGDNSDVTNKNFFHHHVISLGKQLANQNGAHSLENSKGLLYIFETLPTHLKFAILQKDNYKRTPLHYAAQYGMAPVTSTIIHFLKIWNIFDETVSIDDVDIWGDSEGLTPLHLAVFGKHVKTTKVLVDTMTRKISSPYILHVATRLNCSELLSIILKSPGIEINLTDKSSSNETALYIACKLNLKESVECLLDNGADFEIAETTFGWTPIFVAAVDGYKEIIELLLKRGANFIIKDKNRWTAREHAALRGHIGIIEMLTPATYNAFDDLENNLEPAVSPMVSPNLTPQPNLLTHNSVANEVGNKYLKENESVLLITIGTTDIRNNTPALELATVPMSTLHSTELDSALTLVIKARNLPGQPEASFALPLDDNHGIASDPIRFDIVDQDPEDTIIYFDIVPTFDLDHKSVQNKKILGRGVATLRDLCTVVGPQKRSLFNCVKVPILETNSLEILGHIKFEFICVKSFEKIGKIPENADKFWKAMASPKVIGHRGNGMNRNSIKSLQIGENTIDSFIAAASFGAEYVEFDVQLTKDNVPVIYHDFIVAETGMDIPMHELTLEQFLHLSEMSQSKKKTKSDVKKFKDDSYIPSSLRSNTHSITGESNDLETLLHEFNPSQERMKLTKTWKEKEFKANTRGAFIASAFTKLEDLFIKVPKKTGFNIELKYPMLDESQLDDIGQVTYEMNHFCDTILGMVYEKYEGRDILFSSFHPDICMMMKMKQPSFPVLFLTEAGTTFMADIRASSLQNAVRFAKTWKLFGIVSESTPIVHCPRLVRVVKESGLACFTYGVANNDPRNSKLEIAAGVNAVIVDSVLAVRNGLTLP